MWNQAFEENPKIKYIFVNKFIINENKNNWIAYHIKLFTKDV